MGGFADGRPAAEVLAELTALHAGDEPGRGRPGVANTFDSGSASVEDVAVRAFELYLHVNGLYPTSFPSVATLEHEVVAIVGEQVHAPPGAAGSWTSGGTESCLLAAKAARDARPDVQRPRIVFARSAHAAWAKAAGYFGLDPVIVEIDPVAMTADVAAIERAIDDDTVLVVASAPSYGHGVVDPIPEIAAICARRGVRCHVDACIGGWVLPFAEQLGHPVPPWDFRVPGVDSISVDLHKYGYTPKGCSILLYRTAALRRSQYFVGSDWTGYPVVNPTMQSSKSGGLIAAAWAVLRHLGADGYRELVTETLAATRELVDGVGEIPELRILGAPAASLVAVTTNGVDFFAFLDELERLGRSVQPQLSQPNVPPTIHLTMTATHGPHVPDLLHALRTAARTAATREPLPTAEQLRAVDRLTALAAADGGVSPDALTELMVDTGLLSDGRLAPVHALLDHLPPGLRKAVLLAFFEGLNPPL
ncbi:pyridoxal phosphate-dependent decarboxylase family protein [Embleya hyalina]|uniref:Aspartate aminotransferase family protein n=1 Tax=Embleya hyalina TaxID=516124 RepID=A0A401Z6G7_9ACTN|nr:aminotransferase class V-fold PLP-dependent enzyme [Embleya hyalina]GCE02433.1 aspartate aminotransferase family protein [Embleya hyalina]